MAKTRIQGNDSIMSAVMKMCSGNPGAMSVCVRLIHEGPEIDPDSFMGGFSSILSMDTHQIYEDKIWMLYKDICGENLTTMIGLLRGVQLGFMRSSELQEALSGSYGRMDDARISEILGQVRERLPAFAKA